VEALVYLYGGLSYAALYSLAANASATGEPPILRLQGVDADITSQDLGRLLAIHLAALAERTSDSDGAPSPWLAYACRLATAVKRLTGDVVPIFSKGTGIVSESDEAELIRAYRAVTNAGVSLNISLLSNLTKASEALPWVAEPLIVIGLAMLANGDAEGAALHGKRAADILLQWNTAWDKRLSEFHWFSLATLLQQEAPVDQDELDYFAKRVFALLFESKLSPEAMYMRLDAMGVLTSPVPAEEPRVTIAQEPVGGENGLTGLDFGEIPGRFQEYIAGLSDDDVVSQMRRYPSLSENAWWDADDFPIVAGLRSRVSEISAEFAQRKGGIGELAHEPFDAAAWGVFPLQLPGSEGMHHIALPTVANTIGAHRDSVGTNNSVSLLTIAPLSVSTVNGIQTNMYLRCMLAIDGSDQTTVTVNGVMDKLCSGDCLVFDPSFAHEVRNGSTKLTTVIMVDIWHPELTEAEVHLIAGLRRYVAAVSAVI